MDHEQEVAHVKILLDMVRLSLALSSTCWACVWIHPNGIGRGRKDLIIALKCLSNKPTNEACLLPILCANNINMQTCQSSRW